MILNYSKHQGSIMNRRILSTYFPIFIIFYPLPSLGQSYDLLETLVSPFEFIRFYNNEVKDSPIRWRSELENDVLYGEKSDRYYTNSLRITSYRDLNDLYQSDGRALKPMNCSFTQSTLNRTFSNCSQPTLRDGEEFDPSLVRYGFSFGQRMYTPSNYANDPNGIYDRTTIYGDLYDRPFSGWFYLENQITVKNNDSITRHSVSYGLVGEIAGAKGAQEWAHRKPFDSTEKHIPGWASQTDNAPAVQYTYSKQYPKNWSALLGGNQFNWGFTQGIKSELGTVFVRQSVLFGGNIGINWGRDEVCIPAPSFIDGSSRGEKLFDPFSFDRDVSVDACRNGAGDLEIFGSVQYTLALWNYHIQNGAHFPNQSNSNPAVEPSNLAGTSRYYDLEHFFRTESLGLRVNLSDWLAISVGVTHRTAEVKNQLIKEHEYGWLGFEFDWDSALGAIVLPAILVAKGELD